MLSHATRTVSSSTHATPPVTSTVSLPDTLPRRALGGTLQARYELALEPCPQERVLFLPRAGANYRLWVDAVPAQRLAPQAQSSEDIAQAVFLNPRIPMLFRLPAHAHSVVLELEGLAFLDFGLQTLRAGPALALAPVHTHTYTRVIDWTLNVGYLIATLAAMGAWIWTRRRHDQGLAWYLVSSAVWVIRGFYATVNEPMLSPNLYELGVSLQVMLMAPPVVAAALHLVGKWSRAWAWLLGGTTLACVSLLALAAAFPLHAHVLRGASYAVTIGWMVIAFLLAARYRHRLPGWRGWVVVAGYLALLLGLGSDYLYVLGLQDMREDSLSLVVWGYLALLLSLLVVLVDHAMRAVDRIQEINIELDQKVQQRTQEIAELYAQRQQEQLAQADAQARQQERERLVREIHDGIGGQLTTTLRAVERGRYSPQDLEQALQECLDDLRLVMDASSMHDHLDAALAAWRHRWDARLELLGLTLHWEVQDPLETPLLDAQDVLHLLRVLQEAVTNTLKHAQATELNVRVRSDSKVFEMRIVDNGRGWSHDTQRSAGAGRGLASMRQRAEHLGAQLLVTSSPGTGTCIALCKPWNPPR